MFAAVFGFGGRINRLQYFLGCIGLAFAILVLALTAFGLMGFHRPSSFSSSLAAAVLIALAGAILFIWVSLSLQARRFRDMGWNPLLSILAIFGVSLVDQIVARAAPSLSIGHMHQQTLIGGLINLLASGCLLFWPGTDGDIAKPAPPTKAAKAAKPVRERPQPAMRRPAPVMALDQPRTVFGKRGL